MNMFLSHFSAAKYWEIPNLDRILVSGDFNVKVPNFTLMSKAAKYTKKGCKIHQCRLELPKEGAVWRNGVLVASPELVFLQLASKISLQRLILLGLQLCSFPPGHPYKSITTKERLKKFISTTSGHAGQVNSRRALKFIENGSASIMESLVYMTLVLPHTLGGYGLGGAVFNHMISLKNEASKRLNQQRCFADLYYKEKRVAIEYDSFTFHHSPKEQGKDAIRSAILQRHGVRVMHMNTIQLYDPGARDDFARNLARLLGRRISIRAKKYVEMRAQLEILLPIREMDPSAPVSPTPTEIL